jgi:hypothetical protein
VLVLVLVLVLVVLSVLVPVVLSVEAEPLLVGVAVFVRHSKDTLGG